VVTRRGKQGATLGSWRQWPRRWWRGVRRVVRNLRQGPRRMVAHAYPPGTLLFRCNVCGARCASPVAQLTREGSSCPACHSTVRWRAVVATLSQAVYGVSLALPDFPVRKDLVGVGLSDWEGYAVRLKEKFSYRNTFYHQEPRLDICRIDLSMEGTLDFLIASDVFEHVVPPVGVAFRNAWRLLKAGGVLVLTVPYTTTGEATREHFPELFDYHLEVGEGGAPVLVNRTIDGRVQEFRGLEFHGGAGWTLEMRVFSEASVLAALREAGFVGVRIHHEPDLVHGIYWNEVDSLPISARKA
jgi:hypothetical protein